MPPIAGHSTPEQRAAAARATIQHLRATNPELWKEQFPEQWRAEQEEERKQVQEAERKTAEEASKLKESIAQEVHEQLQRKRMEKNERKLKNLRMTLTEEERKQHEARRVDIENAAGRTQEAEAKTVFQEMAMLRLEQKQRLEEERQKYNDTMRTNYSASARLSARLQMGLQNYGNKTNIALTGESGTGKSSLINGIRELRNLSDRGFAAENALQSKRTKKPAAYECARFPGLVLHDTVGSNEENPTKSYFWDKQLYAYDYLLLIVNNSINEIHLEIARNATYCEIPFAVVRTKVDLDIDSTAESVGLDNLNAVERKTLREDIQADFNKNAPELKGVPFFIVSSKVMKFPERNAWKTMDEEQFLSQLMELSNKTGNRE